MKRRVEDAAAERNLVAIIDGDERSDSSVFVNEGANWCFVKAFLYIV